MIVANYSTVRNELKEYCDMVSERGETLIVTRKANRNVVMMSLDSYNNLERELNNARYLAKLERSFDQLYAGRGQEHELIED